MVNAFTYICSRIPNNTLVYLTLKYIFIGVLGGFPVLLRSLPLHLPPQAGISSQARLSPCDPRSMLVSGLRLIPGTGTGVVLGFGFHNLSFFVQNVLIF